MAKIIERIHNVETNEIIDIEREMTFDEIAIAKAAALEQVKDEFELNETKTKRQILLTKLGLTEDEAKLLLS